MGKCEIILCAAIWLNDHKKHNQQPINITEGFVISGRRHNNCYQTLTDIYGDCNGYLSKLDDYTDQQGFITSLDRYVNRKDGWVIARNANQIINYSPSDSDGTLISEDLY